MGSRQFTIGRYVRELVKDLPDGVKITLVFVPPSEDALPAMLTLSFMVTRVLVMHLIPAKMLSGLSEPWIHLLLSNSGSKTLQPFRIVANRTGPVSIQALW